MQILALDVGTSSVKAAVLDTGTAAPVGAVARVPYPLDQPTPDTATIPPERLWDAVARAGHEAAEGCSVQGVGLSCLSPALILLDADDQPLTPILTHLDRQARGEARAVWAEVGQEFLATTGNKPLPGGITAIAYRHLARSQPDVTSRVRRYLHVNGWLGLRLTGTAAFDRGNACFTGLYDTMATRAWSPRWCVYFGIEQSWLPPVMSGDVTLGLLTPEAAALLGISPGIPVKLGTADTSCAMLAADMGPGDLLHVVGTTQVLAVYTDHLQPAPNRLTRLLGVGDAFIYVTHNPVGGVALDWMHQLCFQEQSADVFYQQTVAAAIERETIAVLDPPYLGGDRLEIEPRRAAFRELGLATDRLDLLAAVLQAMRAHHYQALAALGQGDNFRRFFLTGGGGEVLLRLIPEYASQDVVFLEDASLRGVARLFHSA
jgi:sugar (pentulose or hexulose) kinase